MRRYACIAAMSAALAACASPHGAARDRVDESAPAANGSRFAEAATAESTAWIGPVVERALAAHGWRLAEAPPGAAAKSVAGERELGSVTVAFDAAGYRLDYRGGGGPRRALRDGLRSREQWAEALSRDLDAIEAPYRSAARARAALEDAADLARSPGLAPADAPAPIRADDRAPDASPVRQIWGASAGGLTPEALAPVIVEAARRQGWGFEQRRPGALDGGKRGVSATIFLGGSSYDIVCRSASAADCYATRALDEEIQRAIAAGR